MYIVNEWRVVRGEIVSIDKDPEVYQILKYIVITLFGFINTIGIAIIIKIKKNLDVLFVKADITNAKLAALEAVCNERHKKK
jgi:hypothetical protein